MREKSAKYLDLFKYSVYDSNTHMENYHIKHDYNYT